VTDHELVEMATGGDAAAFGELVVRHHRAALRAAMAALGSAHDADDAVQDAWIAARRRLQTFRGHASFRTWLLTIVWNKALDHRRGLVRWVKRTVTLEESFSDAGPGVAVETSRLTLVEGALATSPEAALLGHELQRSIRRLVRALPGKLRDPLLLIGTGEYSYDEVAVMLGQPVGTVKWRVSEARRQIKMKLERLGF